MFMGPYDEGGPWDPRRFEGSVRFINRVWDLVTGDYRLAKADAVVEAELESRLHKTIKKVGDDANAIRFNTAISALMEFVNYAMTVKAMGSASIDIWRASMLSFNLILAPFAPFLAEEMWENQGQKNSVHSQAWPQYSEQLIKDDIVTIIVQINGKLKTEFVINLEDSHRKDELERLAKEALGDKLKEFDIAKTVIVPGRLVNFVTP